ncbi:MAG TPA: 2-amino-3,7-dideoxy-D-threo-hept-6-ulosonate synthase [Patescibacteria group bacterium]|nr:2-amino-3,7-dideoxy-D-threo-hept-6-ulosonate synthase [Patescibacteria group bacterium]
MSGKTKRLGRLFYPATKKMVLVPLDDALLAGPEGGLRDAQEKVRQIVAGGADAIMGFPGLFQHCNQQIQNISGILNLTASTTRGAHTHKVLISSVEEAVKLGMDGVGVHVNISSKYESEMLSHLGKISRECERYGMPLMALMYPRSEHDGVDENYESLLESQPEKYAELVRHAVRVGVELGADIIKTKFTGSTESFRTVIESAMGVPVVIAGGMMMEPEKMLRCAFDAIQAGASGISFGRNVFHRKDSALYVKALKKIVHENGTVEEAMNLLN